MRSWSFLFFVFLIWLTGCYSSRGDSQVRPFAFSYNSYIVSYGGCDNRDSLALKRVGDNLYRDQKNRLYFLTYDYSDEMGKKIPPVFILRFANNCDGIGDSIYDISKKIDVASFRKTADDTYKDKSHTYHFTSTSDGGHLTLMKD